MGALGDRCTSASRVSTTLLPGIGSWRTGPLHHVGHPDSRAGQVAPVDHVLLEALLPAQVALPLPLEPVRPDQIAGAVALVLAACAAPSAEISFM
jgi:hypothetical protein